MKEISREVENGIKEAIRLEINGRKFFLHAADITEHEKGKKMFRFLADEEVKHLEVFGKLFICRGIAYYAPVGGKSWNGQEQ